MPWPWEDTEEQAAPESTEDPSVGEDVLRLLAPLVVPSAYSADEAISQLRDSGGRMVDRVRRGVPEALAHPIDTAEDFMTGAAQTSGASTLVERLGTPRQRPLSQGIAEAMLPGVAQARDLWDINPDRAEAMRHGFEQMHERQRAAEERSPIAYAGGDAAGIGLLAALPVTGAASAEAPLAARVVSTVPETAAYAAAQSEGTSPREVAQDVGASIPIAVAGGTLLHGGLGALEAGAARSASEAQRMQRGVDEARVASLRGHRRGTISIGDRQRVVDTMGNGDLHRAAQAIREGGFVGPFSSPEDIVARTDAAAEREARRLEEIRAAFDAGPTQGLIPVRQVPDALERYGAQLARGESTEPFAGAPRELADQWRRVGTREAERLIPRRSTGEIPEIPAVEEIRRRPDLDPTDYDEGFIDRHRERMGQMIREYGGDGLPSQEALDQLAAHPPMRQSPYRDPSDWTRYTPYDPIDAPPAPIGVDPIDDEGFLARLRDQQQRDALVRSATEEPMRPRALLERALREHDTTIPWTNPRGGQVRLPVEVQRGTRRAIRDALDDYIMPRLPEDLAADFEPARRRWQAAHTAGTVAQEAATRAARSSPIASAVQSGQMFASGGLGAVPSLVGSGAVQALRAREGAMSAAVLESIQRTLASAPERLSRWRPRLIAAERVGRLPLVAEVLRRTDPDFATAIEEIGGTAEPQERPFDPGELDAPEERPFDPSELE